MLFPLGDDNSSRHRTPYVVYGLIGVNVLIFLLQLSLGDSFTNGWAAVPYEIVHHTDLVGTQTIQAGGHAVNLRLYPSPTPIYLTLLTSMFMHGSWLHIGGNMLYLWIFGDQIEDLLGHFRFLVFYLICGFAADIAHIMFNLDSVVPTLGASGAIAGVLGAYLVKYPTNPVRVLMFRVITVVPAVVVLGFWILLQVFSQMTIDADTSGVAYMAHIGGFAAGVVLVFVLAIGVRNAPATS